MSESEEENENFCYFGKSLEPYDEESFPKKRPISVEEQIATDAQGRRRFHGAFTGGFSAGFFNTVGSLEGWAPKDYKSSRSEKASSHIQKPEDFMDEEDLGEHGIAPQVIRATSDYNTSKKRKKQVFSEGPIPGEPVLHKLLTSGNETIGHILLKKLTIKDKIKQNISESKVYGCQIPEPYQISHDIQFKQYEISEIYKEFLTKPKDNTFGLGYVGLDKNRFSLFPDKNHSNFTVIDKSNKKMSISGQAFGVGAFEDEDEDIYVKEDMSKYDFELGGEKKQVVPSKKVDLVFDMFILSKKPLLNKKLYKPPQITHSFTGKHKVKRSRFEPIVKENEPITSRLNPIMRAKYLGEDFDKQYTESKSVVPNQEPKPIKEKKDENSQQPHNALTSNSSEIFESTSIYLNDKFVSSSKKEDVTNILEPVEKMGITHGTEQMHAAVGMKMFGPLTRITLDWVPCALLCKRFNVPEPFVDRPQKSRTRTKNLIFEYQKHIEEEGNLKPGLTEQKTDISKKEETESVKILEENSNEEQIDDEINTDLAKVKEESKSDEQPPENVPKDITERLDIEKHQDLFKAIFLSSDESDNEESTEDKVQSENNDARKEELKSMVLSDQLLPKIKPIKEGILSGVNFHIFSKPNLKIKEENTGTEDLHKEIVETTKIEHYGPKVPELLPACKQQSNKDDIVLSRSDEEWIEKDKAKKKKHKKEKKHKRHKHNKHKHKKK